MPAALEYTSVGGKEEELLNKHFITVFRHGYIRCQGTVLPVYYKEFAEEIFNLEVRDDDVWVCSFPKTGEFCFYISRVSTNKLLVSVVIRVAVNLLIIPWTLRP